MRPQAASHSTKIKVQLKLALTRLRMLQSRDASLTKASHRSVAQLLEAHKLDSARIRVESIIRSDILTELHEILELYCELLLARFPLLDSSLTAPPSSGGSKGGGPPVAVCDPGLEEAVKGIIYAAPRTEIRELGVLRALLGDKFGKEFVASALLGTEGGVSEKVVRRLGVEPPGPELVEGYLEEIARAYGVEWPRGGGATGGAPGGAEELDLLVDMGETSEDEDGRDDGPGGGQALAELEGLLGGSDDPAASSPSSSLPLPPKPQTATTTTATPPPQKAAPRDAERIPRKSTPRAAATKPAAKPEPPQAAPPPPPASGIPDLSELERRFAALKRLD